MAQKITEDTIIGDILFEWNVPEYEKHEKSSTWIIIATIVAIALIIFGIWTNNYLFALIVVLGGIILYLWHHEDPLEVPFAITELGVVIGNKFYSYSDIDAFFIIYDPPEVKKLFFETNSKIRPLIRVPIKEQNPVEIRHALKKYLPEDIEKEEEPLTDELARKWKIN